MAIPPGSRRIGATPPPRRSAVPPQVKATHVTVPKASIKRGLLYALYVGAALFLGGVCYEAGRHHVPAPAPIPGPPEPPRPPKPAKEFRVVFVVDTASNMTQQQLGVLFSSTVTDWLNQHCTKDESGRPGWRKWDKTVDTSNEAKDWKKVWDATKPELGTLPQVVLFIDGKGQAFALPDSEDELIKLLKKYSGA